MKRLSARDIQNISVDILVYIDKLCRENSINYSIFYGSLIGVERHKGYIPWDDDLDIVMPRPDYQKLVSLLSKQNDYILLSPEISDNYRYAFAKLVDPSTKAISKQYYGSEDDNLGVYVDIFPIDGFPTNLDERKTFGDLCEQYRANMLMTLNNSYAISRSWMKAHLKRILLYPKYVKTLKKGNSKFWKNKYEEIVASYPFENAEYCGYMEFINEVWGVFPTEWFKHYEEVEFEGHKFLSIKDRDKFLTLRYGDYMQLPPEEERVTHHPYDFYLKD
ncbi:LicD family protein [Enterococcus viikkiensis]|uniref:LicD family protein n=1 Tax=Enterococcus viikkiensis TaxID=930854 RepID=A0ABU3FNJ4_9ENTE|nr:LicD family protein [Enterococcus viikkiensis]MDT2827537.1 LicD family protein [Enterococcus viikkiensis]